MSVEIGRYCSDDEVHVVRIERARTHSWSESQLLAQLESVGECFVLRVGGQCVAYALFQTVLDQSDLLLIAVEEAHQRQGLAYQLLLGAMDALVADGVVSVFLEVRESNAPARALYEKAGFEVSGRRKQYYPIDRSDSSEVLQALADREDALLMRWTMFD